MLAYRITLGHLEPKASTALALAKAGLTVLTAAVQLSDNKEPGSNKSFFSLLHISSPHLEHPLPGLYGSRTGGQRRETQQQQQHLLCQPVALLVLRLTAQ